MRPSAVFFLMLLACTSCYRMRTSRGGGEVKKISARKFSAHDILVPPGYAIEQVTTGLTFPSSIAFDDKSEMYLIETGYAYGEVWVEPKLLHIKKDGTTNVIAKGGRNGPWNSVTVHNGRFYISEGGALDGGKILKISPEGDITTIVEGLPSIGDHHTNALVVKDGYIYFGQGVATNSGIVGADNKAFGWLKRQPDFHDIPCGDLVLNGTNYESGNILTDNPDDKVATGAFLPFGTPSTNGQVIKGAVPCTGAIMRVPLEGGKIEMVSWGLRNPYGLAIAPSGKLFTTENAYYDRGSRPVWGAGDVLWEVQQNAWYGWPDYSEGKPITSDEEFKPPAKREVKALLKSIPQKPPTPTAILGVHSSSNGLDFSTSKTFGHEGEAFIAQFGDMAPKVGKVLNPVGFKVVRVDVNTGVIRDFAVNKGKRNGPASWLKSGGMERPLAVKFDPSGNTLYVVDFGILKMTDKGPAPQKGTGCVWRISKK
jgi:glucose/arabinose dehydrogenase